MKRYDLRIPWLFLVSFGFFLVRELPASSTKREMEAIHSCGTPELLEAWREKGPGILHTRPTLSGPENTLNTTHFKVHWTESGTDSTTGSYADSIASFAEFCWEGEVDTLGWNSPPPDTLIGHGDGGDYRYDIYVKNLAPGLLGYVQAEHPVSSTPEEDATSSMVLDNTMSNNLLRVTVAHEFNHSCQFGHSYNENISWYENSATWMEDQIYDAINDYYGYLTNSITNPITYPEITITESSGFYPYGGCTWAMLLHQKNGTPNIIQQIWDLQGLHLGNFTMADIDSVLRANYSSSLETSLKEYGVWRYFAGPNDDGNHFEEGGAWTAVPYVDPAHRHSSYPASGSEGSRGPDSLGVNFIRFDTTGFSGGLNISFNGQNSMEWAVPVISYDSSGTSRVQEMTLNGNGDGSIFVIWNGFDHIAMVPMVLTYTGTLVTNLARVGVQSALGGEPLHLSRFTFRPIQTYTYNATFVPSDSASPLVTVVAPNGGERWSIGEVDTIRWIASDSTFVETIELYFSQDNGVTWDTIALNEANDSTYLWTVPNTPSDSCLVRVRAVDPWANVGEDTSDSLFTIGDFTPPLVTVQFPNGGENLAIGDTVAIRWNATDLFGVDSLTLELSTDGGYGWSLLSRGEVNDGNYSWEVPVTPSDSCLVRITGYDPSLNAGVDLSNSLFRISDQTPPAVTLLYPNGGEVWVSGTQDSIQWIATDLFGVDSLSLFLSTDGGGTWNLLSSGEANDSIFILNVPCLPTDSGVVRVVAYDPSLNAGVDVSNSLFTVMDVNPPIVSLIFPNGGEVFEVGDLDTIRWVAQDNCGVNLDLFLSTNGGASWSPIAVGEVNDSTFPWQVPNLLSDSCLIRIIAYDLEPNTDEDTTDGYFTIRDQTPPQVTVIFPNGGEIFEFGDTVTIQWLALDNGGVDSLSLYFSSDGGIFWDILATGEENDSNFTWIVPSVQTTMGLIWIIGFDGGLNTGEDLSNSTFTILPVGVDEENDFRFPISDYRLLQNQPNPFHSTTLIRYIIPGIRGSGDQAISENMNVSVKLMVYDITGRLVETLVNESKESGVYGVQWDAKGLSSGIYFYRLTVGTIHAASGESAKWRELPIQTVTRKMTLLR